MTVEDGLAAGALPRHHGDLFDRVLIAQAVRRRLVAVTADRALRGLRTCAHSADGGAAPPSTT